MLSKMNIFCLYKIIGLSISRFALKINEMRNIRPSSDNVTDNSKYEWNLNVY